MSELFTSIGSLRINLLEINDLFNANDRKKSDSLPIKVYATISIINHNQMQQYRFNTAVISDIDRDTTSLIIKEEFLFENIPSTYVILISLYGIYNNSKNKNFNGFRKMNNSENSIRVEVMGYSRIPVSRLEENQMV